MSDPKGSARLAGTKSGSMGRSGGAQSKYFDIDRGYDRRFYENTCSTYLIIFVVFVVYYICVTLFWWGCFGLGITDSELYTIVSSAVFGASVLVSAGV